ncbi:MAG: hypothetical protein ABI747_02020 [Candidatus Moraniibacteriota bacterium]
MFTSKTKRRNLFQEAFLKKNKPPVNRRSALPGTGRVGKGTIFLWVIFLFTALYTLFFSPWFQITTVEIVGESVVPREVLLDSVWMELSGKRAFVLPRENILLAPTQGISESLILHFPKFRAVSVRRVFPHTLLVQIEEMPFLVRWCSGGPCSVVGNDGKLLTAESAERSYYDETRLTLIERSALPVVATEGELLSGEMKVWAQLYEELSQWTNLTLLKEAETPTRYAHELRVVTGEGWAVFFGTEEPVSQSIEALNIVLSQDLSPERREELLSIDLRVEGRAFLGFKNGGQETVVSEEGEKDTLPKEDPSQKKKEKKN